MDTHAVKLKYVFSRIIDATDNFVYVVVKADVGIGISNKDVINITAEDFSEDKQMHISMSLLRLLTMNLIIKLKQYYSLILRFLRMDIIISIQINIQLGNDGLKCCDENRRMSIQGRMHIFLLTCGDTLMQQPTV